MPWLNKFALVLLLTMGWALPSEAAVTGPVQQTACNVASSAAPTCTYGSAVSSGNMLIALVALRVIQTDTGIADGVNGSWTCPAATNYNDGTSKVLICYFNNTGAGTPTLTLSLGGASATYWNISEWAGVMDTAPEDTTSEGGDTSSPFAHGAGLTSTTAGLIVCASSAGATITSPTPASGFTALTNNGVRDYFQYRIGAATTSTCDYTATGPSSTANAMHAFKEEPAGASVNFFPRRLQVQP